MEALVVLYVKFVLYFANKNPNCEKIIRFVDL